MIKNYPSLYHKIDYHFKSEQLIEQALTHRSKKRQHNERLEFLGDSILGFVIAEALYHKFPHEDEGALSLLRMYLIRGQMLTEMAKRFCLGDFMTFGASEIKSGGHTRSRLLEDAFEALIGAVYLDSNMATVKQKILKWYQAELKTISVEEHTKDAKTHLQEYLQSKIQAPPTYTLLTTEGLSHDQTFTVSVSLGSLNQTYQAKGKSRKQAEHAAARLAIAEIKKQAEIKEVKSDGS